MIGPRAGAAVPSAPLRPLRRSIGTCAVLPRCLSHPPRAADPRRDLSGVITSNTSDTCRDSGLRARDSVPAAKAWRKGWGWWRCMRTNRGSSSAAYASAEHQHARDSACDEPRDQKVGTGLNASEPRSGRGTEERRAPCQRPEICTAGASLRWGRGVFNAGALQDSVREQPR